MWQSFLSFLTRYEPLAVWLEGVALIAIFGLDFSEYLKQGKDRKEQHREILEQMQIMERQAKASTDSVVAAQRHADLLQTQWLEERHRELLRAMSVLDDIQNQVKNWKDISENKWGTVTQATKIMPADSNTVLIQSARHSKELRIDVRETFRMIANADDQIARFYGQQPNYRQPNFMEGAHRNLSEAEPRLAHIIKLFEEMESAPKP